MSTQPVTLDFSKAQPLDQGQPVTLDFSKAQPIAAQPQQPVKPELMNPLPTENIPVIGQMAQPLGEVAAGLRYDPKFRSDTATYGVASAAVAGGPAAATEAIPNVLPATIAGAKAIGAWATRNPIPAYLLYKILFEHNAVVKLIKGAPVGAPNE